MKIGRKAVSLFWAAVVLAIVLLTWFGLAVAYPDIASVRYFPDRLFRLVKTVMGTDPLGSALESPDVPWQLIVAKLLVTLVLIRGLMKIVGSVFRDNVTQLRVMFKKHPTVIVGAGRKGRRIAADLRERHHESAVIIERAAGAGDAARVAPLRREGHLVIAGDATSQPVLKSAGAHRARRVICFAQEQKTGIQVAGLVRELWSARGDLRGETCDCHVHLDNPQLVDLFRSHVQAEMQPVRVHFFNLHKMVARSLFERFPKELAPALMNGARRVRVDLIGFGQEAQAILVQGLRVLHLGLPDGVQWHVWVDASTAGKARQTLAARHPMADHIADIRFHGSDAHYRALVDDAFACPEDTLQIVICAHPGDEDNISAAAELLQAVPNARFPVFARCADIDGLPALLAGTQPRLRLFGNLADFCTVEMICGEQQDRIARAIHADYVGLAQGTASESDAYKSGWADLGEDARDANRAQADHIAYKLMAVQGDVTRIDGEVLEFLAMTEHQRWAAHRYLNGWRYGAERDDERRTHPSLLPWFELSEAEREKDRDAVRRLPQLLGLSGRPAPAANPVPQTFEEEPPVGTSASNVQG
ncbi:NAD-binding protein [Diaphorobacter caeni]|uniref:NAD-binding protein n=1 Tax=Diaphorobacter caeni TaxID=2784387 RepID=UPI00188F7964|nr:NAD-binding protein [Diaphorobacter caeni]MBF5005320.1 NAD-binding protein [Diaphorobacter caeni]